MKYKAKHGIILAKIGGKALLISANNLHDQVPYVTEINETTEMCWEMIEMGVETEKIIETLLQEYEIDNPEQVRKDIYDLFEVMYKRGYIEEVRSQEEII